MARAEKHRARLIEQGVSPEEAEREFRAMTEGYSTLDVDSSKVNLPPWLAEICIEYAEELVTERPWVSLGMGGVMPLPIPARAIDEALRRRGLEPDEILGLAARQIWRALDADDLQDIRSQMR